MATTELLETMVAVTDAPSALTGVPLPDLRHAVKVVDAPSHRAGYWAGAPSAVRVGGAFYVAYRLRRPPGKGRGYATIVARSSDGLEFEPLVKLVSRDFDAESFARPALVPMANGRWRLYVSCATPRTLHWRVEVVEADDPAAFSAMNRRTVLPGDDYIAIKDPVITCSDGRWQLWASCHALADPARADRIVTGYATSVDGLDWTWRRVALEGRPGQWDDWGARISDVLPGPDGLLAFYDGKASSAEDTEERVGLAVGQDDGRFCAAGDGPVAASPHGGGGLRYVSVVPLPDGSHRLYYEATESAGEHSLYTQHVPAP